MSIILILTFGLLNLALSLYSVHKIKQSQKKLSFIYWWGFLSGAFVWEDMLVFGLLQFGFALFTTIINDPEVWLICFLIFWIVRSAGETLYFFLQQFIEPKHHPHNIRGHFVLLKKVFGDISDQKCFIIMQVLMQSITVISAIVLIFVLI